MALPSSFVHEFEPTVHAIIKKQLGFSEPTLLSATINCLLQGTSRDMLEKRLSGLLDHRKAATLASHISEAVDEFCKANDSKTNRKRGFSDMPPNEAVEAKKACLDSAAPPQSASMTSEQIRAMMSNTLKELQERKKALSVLRSQGAGSDASSVGQTSLPKVELSADKAKTIANLQAQIASRIQKLTGAAALPETVPVANDRPTAVILDDKGRTVDASGQEIQLAHHVPTLKANLRAKKRDELREHLRGAEHADQETKFFDPRLVPKTASRAKKGNFKFVEPGRFQKEGQRLRMKAQLEKLQSEIATVARKTGITSATQLARLVPKGDDKEMVPKLEWWDALILKNGIVSSYHLDELKRDAITNLIEHPIQLKPMEPLVAPELPVFLTKKERKKLRRQNRREAWKEKQDKIRLGILPPDQPKVKMSNLMRVLGNEAIQDPTKVEAHVREQMAKRLANHEKANAERKLTPEQRKEKISKKLKEDTSAGVHVAVYRLKNLSNQSKKFKVETNAKQLYMTGCVVIYEDVNVVVVEGGPKQQKKYKQLMLSRIKWDEDMYVDKFGQKHENRCELVWEGQTKERNFGEVKFKQCPSESFAREHFKRANVEHYWDQAYSGAVLEASGQL